MKVLFAIKTCWKYRQRREAQRLTWLPELANWATDHLFISGWPERLGPTGPFQSAVENEKYVLSVKCADDFSCIGPKVKAACQMMIAKSYDLLVVLDDDTYVVPERLINLCRQHYDEKVDVTAFFRTQPVHYPQGSAYILNRRAASILLNSKRLDEKGPDDVLVGEALLASGQLLTVKHTNQLHPGPDWRLVTPLKNNDVATTHKCLPRDMISAHYEWLHSNA